MLLSMTGYGKAETTFNNKRIHVEIKSLNSKNIDISTRLSSLFFSKDLEIRNYLTHCLIRGKVDFSLWIDDLNTTQSTTINSDMVHSYVTQIKNISKEQNLSEPSDWWDVISHLPNITLQPANNEISDEDWMPVRKTIEEATKQLIKFREQEGNAVKTKFKEKLSNITSYLSEVENFETSRIDKIRKTIVDNLKLLPNIEYDKNRLEQEMIYYIEKLDINEEKQRLANHLKYFANTMDSDDIQGKKLGFISQEMGREINTMGSKSNQADMQNLVVKMKDELEQIKEQVLNVL